jgi:predicted GTPase
MLLIGEFTNVQDESFCLNLLANFLQLRNSLTELLVAHGITNFRVLSPNLTEAGKSSFCNELFKGQRVQQGSCRLQFLLNDQKNFVISVLTDLKSGRNPIITARVLSL